MAREVGGGNGSLLNDLEQFLDDGAIHWERARGKASGRVTTVAGEEGLLARSLRPCKGMLLNLSLPDPCERP